ncbi:hypothetical protein L226DRAFT_576680 [Lentinus tigrinus ALCF2SS1-7]|uniref:Uncharacterized protein n=1 Tax=Lentinus tigrinus ALCF2SS1-6 TaxID=1328759 RepID=A0A5C2RMY5_9APHY|nr:hypothetical protein L227DRAFT_617449 [Lentinus tigrinus ALCF2SS1-6]RPD68111.1 hypothetical protein L226DRAFT_576680 [Lentinus tigrinus ALCF2SS1-7]
MSAPPNSDTHTNAEASPAGGTPQNYDRPRSVPIGQVLRRVWDALPQEAKDEFARLDQEREAEDARRAQSRGICEPEWYELDISDDFCPTLAAPPVSESEGLELVSMVEDTPQAWAPPLLSGFHVDRVQEAAAFEIMARDLAERHVDPNAARVHAEFAEVLMRERLVREMMHEQGTDTAGRNE